VSGVQDALGSPVTLLATSSGIHTVLQPGKQRARLGRTDLIPRWLRSRTVERVGVTDADATVTGLVLLRARKAKTALSCASPMPCHPSMMLLRGKKSSCTCGQVSTVLEPSRAKIPKGMGRRGKTAGKCRPSIGKSFVSTTDRVRRTHLCKWGG
jgi:hypothetical protein